MSRKSPPPAAHKPSKELGRPAGGWRLRLYIIIFEADTRMGRAFDLALLALIVFSVGIVMLDSVASIRNHWGSVFDWFQWLFTIIFTIEYVLRLLCVRHPWRYATSFFGVIDLLAIAPTYLALFFPELHALIDVRVIRMLRIFRILKLTTYVAEFRDLGEALVASRRKIAVFMSFVMLIVIVMGTLMYVIEGPEHGFTSIPTAIYWAITTVTTVGFGDITPKTDLGRALASTMMLIGWGTLAVPTGIVSAEFATRRERLAPTTRTCHECLSEGHLVSAQFCKDCGAGLPAYQAGK